MSKISISSAEPTSNKQAILFLNKLLDMPILSARKRLETGKLGLFYTTELLGNDHIERSNEILKILDFFEEKNIKLYIMLIPYGMDWNEVEDWNEHRETPTQIRNLLARTKEQYS